MDPKREVQDLSDLLKAIWTIQKKASLQVMWSSDLWRMLTFQGLCHRIQGHEGEDMPTVCCEEVQVDEGEEQDQELLLS